MYPVPRLSPCLTEHPSDVVTYVGNLLSKARQRLLAWCIPSYGAPFEQALQPFIQAVQRGDGLLLATDGDLKNDYGNFGVILDIDSTVEWESAGPVDGDPTTANSKQSELVGYASSLELLLMLETLTSFPNGGVVKVATNTWMDSISAGKHLHNLHKGIKVRRKYPHDADILAHIGWL